jgi:N-acyl-D-aspartate/D-glutamate deacylase
MIGTWVREKEAWSLERAIALMTAEPADFFGIRDRGCLVPGAAADLAIFNFDEVGACSVEPAYDLPRGGRGMIMKARGMEYVVVNGRVILASNRYTGKTPGRVLRLMRLAATEDYRT